MLDLINKSGELQNVLRAVTTNGMSILLTALLGVVVIWVYAVVGFAMRAEDFVKDDCAERSLDLTTSGWPPTPLGCRC